MARHPLVYVEWIDPHSVDAWTPVSSFNKPDPCFCFSVGWLTHQDKQRVIIAPHVTFESTKEASISGVMEIPRGVIRRLKKIGGKKLSLNLEN